MEEHIIQILQQYKTAKAKLLALDSELKLLHVKLEQAKSARDVEKIKHCQIMLEQKQGEYWQQQLVVFSFQEKRGSEKITVPENRSVTE